MRATSGPAWATRVCTDHAGRAGLHLVAVLTERVVDPVHVRHGQHAGAAELSLPLGREADLKMARAGAAMLHLAGSGDPKTLLDTLVGLLLRNGKLLDDSMA